MKCISPLLIRTDGRRDVVPCGKCNYCLQTKRADWTFRLKQELKISSSAFFLTLTYADDCIPFSSADLPELRKRDCQLFMKRLRKENSRQLRYYTVGEYGTVTFRPHYHSILFNLDLQLVSQLPKIWSLGHVHVGDVKTASIHYVTKYVINRVGEFENREPP